MSDRKNFYITTPIYYANAKPHLGHAYTTIAADVLARFYRDIFLNLREKDKFKVFLLTGTDEHGSKIARKAAAEEKNPQQLVDEVAEDFKRLWDKLGIQYDNFIRTTNPKHKKAVQKVLQTLYDRGLIYKGEYEGFYCVGCEQFKNKSDLVDGKCPDHGTTPEWMREESYMLKMSDKQEELIEKIKNDKFKITPEKYKKEILSFLEKEKLQDISISREKVEWGISLPFDPNHTAYVWFDAFLSYLTGLGWNGDEKNIPIFWPADIQLIGKDILRVHATIWPIILLHLGFELPRKLFVHGHILSEGRKMSKTLGNVIGVEEMLERFSVDGTRYLLLSAGIFGNDIDITIERLVEKYNADLANGLGNLVSRVVKLLQSFEIHFAYYDERTNLKLKPNDKISEFIEKLEIDKALSYIWDIVRQSNKYIEETKPWELIKDVSRKEEFEEVMKKLIVDVYSISELLEPFLPETSKKIKKALKTKESVILFQRIKIS